MRYHTLQKIDAPDNLALILNGYMKALSTIDIFTTPRESMGEFNRLLAERSALTDESEVSEEVADLFGHRISRFYMLHVLNNSLTDWHRHLTWAIEALEKFFNEYDGDPKRFAIQHRINVLEDDCGGEDSDWEEDGTDEEGEPKYKVVYKDDPAALAAYSFASTIEQHFAGYEEHGDRIGSSQVTDYAYFTGAVRIEADLSPTKFFSEFFKVDIPLYRIDEGGQPVVMSEGDKIESAINEGITNARIIAWFELALKESANAVLLHSIATTKEQFQQLFEQLLRIRDLDFPEPEAHLVVAD